ncbi:MAG: restriction endonuclease subunit S [Thermodesulfovibrionales bacterium]|nr:restriction endonuclease subunit S [Thermodesulfovibrionales bacterium]
MAQVKSLQTGIKFKDTPIGKIPVDWEIRKLGEISEVRRGASPRPINDSKWFGGTVGWVRISDVTSSKKYLHRTKDYLSDEGVKNSVRIKRGEVILSICATIGRPIIVAMDACIHDGFVWFDGLKEDIDREFFYYFLENKGKVLASQRQTGTQGNLNTSIISNSYIPLPPFSEQKKIAEILTTVDGAIEETARIIEKTKELKKGLMQQLLTRGIGHKKFKKTEIGEIPKEWEVRSLGDLCERKPEYGANVSAIDKNNDLPRYVRITDVTDDGYLLNDTWQSIDKRSAEPYILREGDFLFARSGATVGKTYLYRKEDAECAFAGYMIRFRPDSVKLLPEFLFQFTHSDFYYNWVKGMLRAGAQPNINGTEYAGLIIPKPPIDEQRKIVSVLSAMDKEIKNETDHRRNIEALKKSLMQILLTGKVRVKLD